jgi:P-type Ca2+ transporter type 2C
LPQSTRAIAIPIHQAVPGRVRFEVKSLRRSKNLAAYLETTLVRMPPIKKVKVNEATGTILILYQIKNLGEEDLRGMVEGLIQAGQYANGTVLSDKPKIEVEESWHLMSSQEALKALRTDSEKGLTKAKAASRLRSYGPNLIPISSRRTEGDIFFDQLSTVPTALLGAASLFSFLTRARGEGLAIIGVIAINTFLGFYIEKRAEKNLHLLLQPSFPEVEVLRNGKKVRLAAEELVPGDLLILKNGDVVPADSRVLESHNLSVDESALTGESLAVYKSSKTLKDPKTALGDRKNILYRGTIIATGQGKAVVVSTGQRTEIGKIQSLIQTAEVPQARVQKQLEEMTKATVKIGAIVFVVIFILGLLRGYRFSEMLKSTISLAVAAIPEGLPTIATTSLVNGMLALKEKDVLVRRLDAVEALGALKTVCFDKTGTLTQNRMRLESVFVRSEGAPLAWPPQTRRVSKDLRKLFIIMSLCSEVEVRSSFKGRRTFQLKGSPTEKSLIKGAYQVGVAVHRIRRQFPLLSTQYRTEYDAYMKTLHRTPVSDVELVAVKGRPDEVLAICSHELQRGRKVRLDGKSKKRILDENEKMARQALRVLGVAFQEIRSGQSGPMIWVGLVGLNDPIKTGVAHLMDQLHGARINTSMITGDQEVTARAVAQALHLNNGSEFKLINSFNLEEASEEELISWVLNTHVFSRVSPSHKLKIIQALQKNGAVVGMTGDGFNDGPALRAADVGIAMGHHGSEVTRQIADVVLVKDDLRSVYSAVQEGRRVGDNIQKAVQFLLATNLSEIFLSFLSLSMGKGNPLNPAQLLWINLLTDIFPELALIFDPVDPDVMLRAPKPLGAPLLNSKEMKTISMDSVMITLGALAAYLYGVRRYGQGSRASTIAYVTLTTAQLFHVFTVRARSWQSGFKKVPPNPYVMGSLFLGLLSEAFSLYVPALRKLMNTTPMGKRDLLFISSGVLIPFLLNELRHHRDIRRDLEQRGTQLLQS